MVASSLAASGHGPHRLLRVLAQTLRNAAQRHLTGDLGVIAATLLEFLYGLPFAVIWLTVAWVGFCRTRRLAAVDAAFRVWTFVAAVSQIAATALLLRNMVERNFAIGVASVAVVLLLLPADDPSRSSIARGWAPRPGTAVPGSGAAFGMVAVIGYRGAPWRRRRSSWPACSVSDRAGPSWKANLGERIAGSCDDQPVRSRRGPPSVTSTR